MDIAIPPHSELSEQSVIGSLMLSETAYDEVAGVIQPSHFYSHDNADVYSVICEMYVDRKTVDVITVAEELERRGKLDGIGGLSYLSGLAHNTPSASNIKHYSANVIETWQARRLIDVSRSMEHMIHDGTPVPEAIDKASSMLSEIAESRSSGEPTHIRDALPGLINLIDDAFTSGTGIVGLPTGIADLDKKLGGLRGGNIVFIAGRPGMGKTTLAMQIANHVAKLGTTTLVFSMEMSKTELAAREVAREAKLSVEDVLAGRIDENGWVGITAAVGRMGDLNIIVDDTGGLSISELTARARKSKRKHNIGLIVIDYIQLMRGEGGNNRNEQIEEISRGLKKLVKELDVPALVLSQLSRKCEERANKRPINSDLRESGSLEQDADIIMFVYRDELYNTDTDAKGIAEIIIGKRRMGAPGTVYTSFDGGAFRDLEHGYRPNQDRPKTKRGFV